MSVGVVLFLVYFLGSGLFSACYAARLSASKQTLQVHKHLKRLNKPPIKSIQVILLFLFLCLRSRSVGIMLGFFNGEDVVISGEFSLEFSSFMFGLLRG